MKINLVNNLIFSKLILIHYSRIIYYLLVLTITF